MAFRDDLVANINLMIAPEEVVWSQQNIAELAKPYTTIMILGSIRVGHPESSFDYINDVERIKYWHNTTIRITRAHDAKLPNRQTAEEFINDFLDKLYFSEFQNAWKLSGISVVPGNVSDISEITDDIRYDDRAILDINAIHYTEKDQVITDFIETVEVTKI